LKWCAEYRANWKLVSPKPAVKQNILEGHNSSSDGDEETQRQALRTDERIELFTSG